MRDALAVLMALGMGLGLAYATARVAEAGAAVEHQDGPAANDGRAGYDQLKHAAAAAGKADLVAVVKVIDIAETPPGKDAEAAGKAAAAGSQQGKDKLVDAEIVEVLKGDRDVKKVRVGVKTARIGQNEHAMFSEDREFANGIGGVHKVRSQVGVPFTPAKGKLMLVFLKAVEVKKEDKGQVPGKTYRFIPPLLDGVPEKGVAAVKSALKKLAEWNDPPKLSAEEEAAARKLIDELGSNDCAAREAATEALASGAFGIRPLVEAAVKSEDLEVEQRARLVLKAIEPEGLKMPDPDNVRLWMRGGAAAQ